MVLREERESTVPPGVSDGVGWESRLPDPKIPYSSQYREHTLRHERFVSFDLRCVEILIMLQTSCRRRVSPTFERIPLNCPCFGVSGYGAAIWTSSIISSSERIFANTTNLLDGVATLTRRASEGQFLESCQLSASGPLTNLIHQPDEPAGALDRVMSPSLARESDSPARQAGWGLGRCAATSHQLTNVMHQPSTSWLGSLSLAPGPSKAIPLQYRYRCLPGLLHLRGGFK
jgi:hypothetical protein